MMNGIVVALAVGFAAAIGAQARYGLQLLLARMRQQTVGREANSIFPWAVLVANAVGSALLGALVGAVASGLVDPVWVLIAGVGFAGGLTTFSTWTFDTVQLWTAGNRGGAVANVFVNLVLGLAFAIAGFSVVCELTSP